MDVIFSVRRAIALYNSIMFDEFDTARVCDEWSCDGGAYRRTTIIWNGKLSRLAVPPIAYMQRRNLISNTAWRHDFHSAIWLTHENVIKDAWRRLVSLIRIKRQLPKCQWMIIIKFVGCRTQMKMNEKSDKKKI